MTKKITDRAVLIIALAYFFLNDLFYLNNIPSLVFYTSDYIFKTIILVLIIQSMSDFRSETKALIKGMVKPLELVLWTLGLMIIGILVDQYLWRFMSDLLPKVSWSINYPHINNNLHYWFDLTYGLAIVALVEEYVFRKLIPEKLAFIKSKLLILLLSVLIFGFAHWSFGPHAILTTAIWAIVPTISLWRTKSLLPAVLAHFITNFAAWSGIIPY